MLGKSHQLLGGVNCWAEKEAGVAAGKQMWTFPDRHSAEVPEHPVNTELLLTAMHCMQQG